VVNAAAFLMKPPSPVVGDQSIKDHYSERAMMTVLGQGCYRSPFGICGSGQLLAAVLSHRRELGDSGCLAVRGREVNLLRGELSVRLN
jgi:hypothetical protein